MSICLMFVQREAGEATLLISRWWIKHNTFNSLVVKSAQLMWKSPIIREACNEWQNALNSKTTLLDVTPCENGGNGFLSF